MQSRIKKTGLCCVVLLTWLANSGLAKEPNSAVISERRITPFVKAVQRIELSVVNIHTRRTETKDAVFGAKKLNGMGTGVVVDERGYIVTNEHVIHGVDQDAIRVELLSGSQLQARVISFDRRKDLAIIKVETPAPLPVAPFGTSCDLMRGETVFAVGNAFGYTHTLTRGIISALGRDVEVNEKIGYKNLIQTDASINPGNSGGPLVNLDGQVIGINVAIRAGAQRIGFAIPIDSARKTISRLLNNEKFGTYHGLITLDVKSTGSMKLVVEGTDVNSPAALAGLLPKDQVIKAGKTPVSDRADLERALLGMVPGSDIPLVIKRGTEESTITLKIGRNGERPVAPTVARPAMVARANNGETPREKVWRLLGLKFERLAKNQLPQKFRKRFEGGLRIVEVRSDSLTGAKSLAMGDVIVGLAEYQMTSVENVYYVLKHRKPKDAAPLEFQIITGEQIVPKLFKLPVKK